MRAPVRVIRLVIARGGMVSDLDLGGGGRS